MRSVSGWQADDGSFFTSPEECEEYEANRWLAQLCDSNGWDYQAIRLVLESNTTVMRRYVDAYEAACKVRAAQVHKTEVNEAADRLASRSSSERGDETGIGPREHTGAAQEPEAAQQLEAGGSEYMHSLGSGERTEDVSEAGAVPSLGVRDNRTSGVRRRKDLATRPDTETGRSRGGSSD